MRPALLAAFLIGVFAALALLTSTHPTPTTGPTSTTDHGTAQTLETDHR